MTIFSIVTALPDRRIKASEEWKNYHKLLAGCDRDRTLVNLIRLAAYPGCRSEELWSLKVQNVADDRFEVLYAKP